MAVYLFDKLINAILTGNQKSTVSETKLMIKSGAERKEIIINAVETALEKLDAKCTVEQINLLERMLSGRAVTAVMKDLFPDGESEESYKGKLILAALEGDVHDIGKKYSENG